MFYDIVQVVPYEDYTVQVYFEDGKIVSFDVKPLLEKPVFQPLRDRKIFFDTCTIMNNTLAWDLSGNRDAARCVDIDPDMLYGLENVADSIA